MSRDDDLIMYFHKRHVQLLQRLFATYKGLQKLVTLKYVVFKINVDLFSQAEMPDWNQELPDGTRKKVLMPRILFVHIQTFASSCLSLIACRDFQGFSSRLHEIFLILIILNCCNKVNYTVQQLPGSRFGGEFS